MARKSSQAKDVEDFEVSDDDLDELTEEDDFEEDDKASLGILYGALARARHVTMSAKQLHELIHSGTVNLNPEYQRDVVWPESKQIGLVQSLFLNYYVPPIIFAVSVNEDGNETRATIDGKQRCTSIHRFMDGEIPFVSANGQKYWYRAGNARGKPLPKNLKDRFDMVNVVAVEYDNISDQEQRDIFQRVQLGVPLSAAEKLQAIPGPWSTWISELLKKYIFEPGTLAEAITWDVKRAKPFQHVMSMAVLCHDPGRVAKPPNAIELTKWLNRSDGPDDNFKKKIEMTLSLFVNIAVNFKKAAFETVPAKVLAPVEFWFTGFLIFQRMGTTPIPVMASQISDMRKAIRAKHRDIFTNSKVTADFARFFDRLPPYKLSRGEVAAAAEWEGEEPDSTDILAKKRKRDMAEEVNDPDYRGGPVIKNANNNTVGLRNRAGESGPARAPVQAAPPPVRPGGSAMDASVGGVGFNPHFGAANGHAVQNPYQPRPQVQGWAGSANMGSGATSAYQPRTYNPQQQYR